MIITSKEIVAYLLLFLLLTSPIYYNTYYIIYNITNDNYISGLTLWLCSVITTNTMFLFILGLSSNIDENRNNRHRLLNGVL